MRHIGNLPDERQARLLGDFLVAQGIRNEMEHDLNGSWAIWIREEDAVPTAQNWLQQFRSNPDASEFRRAQTEAAKLRATEAQDLAKYQQRVRTRKSLFPNTRAYGVGWLTYALIIVCIVVAIYSKLGENREFLRHLFISDPAGGGEGMLPEVRAGEVWRLFTPIFLHFGLMHLIFNLMWLYQLGCMIEARQGAGRLALVVAATALFSNFGEYYFSQPNFGGMSGVVYGLAGYVWISGRIYPASGLFLDPVNAKILVIWLVICFAGIMGPVANYAHLVGLIVGLAGGFLSAQLARRKPE